MSEKLIFPETDFEELFTDLHASGLWSDGKLISDAMAWEKPSEILQLYRKEKQQPSFDIKAFFQAHFEKADSKAIDYKSDKSAPVEDHIEKLWPILSREPDDAEYYSTLIPLPYPYIVPGGRFNEIYYWDSYFTMLGLIESKKTDMVEHMIKNFAHMIKNYGFIPNGNRSYYLGRSQPPFFSLMVDLLAKQKGERILLEYLEEMVLEHAFWMEGAHLINKEVRAHKRVVLLKDGEILNRYFDNMHSPRAEMYQDDVELIKDKGRKGEETLMHIRAACESGWDFSSRWCAEKRNLSTIRTCDLVQVDLNCLLYHLESCIEQAFDLKKDKENASKFSELASKRKEAIQKYCWNRDIGTYADYHHLENRVSDSIHAAASFPLAFKIADTEQAKKVAETFENHLLKDGGLMTTNIDSGQQWDAPNGWAPLQWMAIWGLRNYNLNELADQIKSRWTALNIKVFKNTGKLMEKYNVEDIGLLSGGGEYPVQDGFGWTNGVLLKLLREEN